MKALRKTNCVSNKIFLAAKPKNKQNKERDCLLKKYEEAALKNALYFNQICTK